MLGAFCAFTMAFVPRANSCCGFSSSPNSVIGFKGQANIVIWDPNTQIEHFVRTASFSANSDEFEFVAPTPSMPTISSADRSCFDLLHKLSNSETPSSGFGGGGGYGGGGGGGVSVHQSLDVGSMRATTLTAVDADSLKKWLEENEYKVSPTQTVWFDHYIKKGWFLTAFKFNAKKKDIQTEAIRMTFKTSEPYNPYYVPKDNWSKNSRLELFLITPVPMKGFVGKSTPWRPIPSAPKQMIESDVQDLSSSLKLTRSELPTICYFSRYLDPDFAKGVNEDLFFRRTAIGTF